MSALPPVPRLRGAPLLLVMTGLLVTLFLEALDQTVVTTALPKILASLQGFDRYVWTVTAYILFSAIAIPIAGKLSDQFGRKGFLLGGTAVFLLGSALSGAAWSMDVLILSRALQGLGAGTGIALATVTVADLFPPEERAKWQSLFGVVYGVSSLVGPTLGGLLADYGPLWANLVTEETRWRWVFYLNLPIGAAVLFLLGVFLPPDLSVRTSSHRGWEAFKRIDWAGIVLSALGTASLLLGLTWGGNGTWGWNSGPVLGALGAAAVLFAGFSLVERRASEPIVSFALFRNQTFAVASLLSMVQMMALVGLALYLPYFLQTVLGVTATGSGVALTPMNVSSVLGAALGGALLMATRRHKLLTLGAALLLSLGTLLMATMSGATEVGTAVVFMVLAGLGLGPFFSVLTVVTQNSLPANRLGTGTSLLQYLGQFGSVLGAAVVGAAVTQSLSAGEAPAAALRAGFTVIFAFALILVLATLFWPKTNPKDTPSRETSDNPA